MAKWELETGGTLGDGMVDYPVTYPRSDADRRGVPMEQVGANPAAGDGDDDEEVGGDTDTTYGKDEFEGM